MNEELIRRAEDLARRCEKSGSVTHSVFLTPAEQYALSSWRPAADCTVLLHGGVENSERAAAFFLPDWMDPADLDPAETIRCVKVTAHFGAPGHRDYLGSLMGLGVRREWLGDILIQDSVAHVLCLHTVEREILTLEKVGRCGVKTASVPLSEIPAIERKVRPVSFTVQSARFDAVLAGLFHLSRTAAADHIRAGDASLNYSECLRPDAPVEPGDVLSLRGCGKARVTELGGQSRKGRQFLIGEVYC